MITLNNTEILAPCGNWDMVKAAVEASADAIYLGINEFSARAYAENFTISDIKDVVRYCHLRGLKVYVTFNTLIKQSEIQEAFDYVVDLYNCDVDALIIQDLGLLYLIRKNLSDLEVHASTQMNINNVFGAKIAKKLGFSRIVLARETSLEELKKIHDQVDIDIEVFVHGSLCVCQSGQCLMSSSIGNRSANRGRCAQPCRKDYLLLDKNKNIKSDKKSFLSPKDLCTIDNIEEIAKYADSLKIEGRMKSKEYVYAVVKSYRDRLENKESSSELLKDVQNRGYSKGLINSENYRDFVELDRKNSVKGKTIGRITKDHKIKFTDKVEKNDILVIRSDRGNTYQITACKNHCKDEVYAYKNMADSKINSPVKRVMSIYLKNKSEEEKKISYPVNIYFKARKNKPVEASINGKIIKSDVIAEEAKNLPIDISYVKKQLLKLGDYPVHLENIDIEVDDNIFLAKSDINKIRRNLLEAYLEDKANYNKRDFKNYIILEKFEKISRKRTPIEIFEEKISGYSNKLDNSYIVRVPRLLDSKSYQSFIGKCKENKVDRFLINNLGDFCIQDYIKDCRFVTDYQMNVFNIYAVKVLEDLGADTITISVELNKKEIADIVNFYDYRYELVVDDNVVVMTSAYCPYASLTKCDNKSCETCYYNEGYLSYEKDKYHVIRNGNYSTIEASHKQKLDKNDLSDLNIYSYRLREDDKRKSDDFHFNKGIL